MGGARRDSRDDRYEQHTLNTKLIACRCSLPPRICWYKSFILVPFFTFPYFFDCTNKIHIYIYIYIYMYGLQCVRALVQTSDLSASVCFVTLTCTSFTLALLNISPCSLPFPSRRLSPTSNQASSGPGQQL